MLAHSKKEQTIPADGAVLKAAPDAIGMGFDAPMRITLITLKRADGTAIDLARTDAMQPVTSFSAQPQSPLAPGTYRVEWRGMAEDGHVMTGAFGFRVE